MCLNHSCSHDFNAPFAYLPLGVPRHIRFTDKLGSLLELLQPKRFPGGVTNEVSFTTVGNETDSSNQQRRVVVTTSLIVRVMGYG
jgi:hypothetical protein